MMHKLFFIFLFAATAAAASEPVKSPNPPTVIWKSCKNNPMTVMCFIRATVQAV